MLSQTDLIAHREHCSADGRLLGSMGAPLGQQTRIRRMASEYALSPLRGQLMAVQGLEEAPRRLRRRSVRVLAHDVHGHRLIELSRTRLGHRPGFAHAVAFHGFDESEILIGGTALVALKQEIKSAIEIATSGSDLPVRVFNGTCRWRSSTPRVDFVPAGGAVSLRGAILCHQRGRSQVRFGVGGMASDKRPDCAL